MFSFSVLFVEVLWQTGKKPSFRCADYGTAINRLEGCAQEIWGEQACVTVFGSSVADAKPSFGIADEKYGARTVEVSPGAAENKLDGFVEVLFHWDVPTER